MKPIRALIRAEDCGDGSYSTLLYYPKDAKHLPPDGHRYDIAELARPWLVHRLGHRPHGPAGVPEQV